MNLKNILIRNGAIRVFLKPDALYLRLPGHAKVYPRPGSDCLLLDSIHLLSDIKYFFKHDIAQGNE